MATPCFAIFREAGPRKGHTTQGRFMSLGASSLTTLSRPGHSCGDGGYDVSQLAPYLELRACPFAGRVRAVFLNSSACNLMAGRDGQGIKLRRPVARAGSSDPIDPADSSARRGWCSGRFRADRTSGDAKSGKTKPPWYAAGVLGGKFRRYRDETPTSITCARTPTPGHS